LVLTFTAALVAAAAVFYTAWDLLGVRGLAPEHRIDSKALFDLVKVSFGVVVGAGALVALVVAYRRQRVDEDGALREATRLHTERFTTAVSQLGHDSVAVRLGGLHALAGLADDAPTRHLRQTCIDVLCAYLRLPYTTESDLTAYDADARHAYLSMLEVRHTAIRLIRDHLRRPLDHPHSWHGHDFDFTHATFDGGEDFSEAEFSGGVVSFHGAKFSGGGVSFLEAEFSGGGVDFSDAEFTGGEVSFYNANFSGGEVSFYNANFSDGEVDFSDAEFSDGVVSFYKARFSGGGVSFLDAEFSGGGVSFSDAEFSDGVVDFSKAKFSGGEVSFSDAKFTVKGPFLGPEFTSSEVSFSDAEFSGGTVDFSRSTGKAPSGLVPLNGSVLPTGLYLPAAWST
jgi:uncharacterized protein YjbI with pentapeptide repeats